MNSYLAIFTSILISVSATCVTNDTNCVDIDNSGDSFDTVLKDIESYKPINIMNGVTFQVEKSVVKDVGNFESSRQGRVLKYINRHAFRLDLGFVNLRLGRSEEHPDKMELSIYTPDTQTGRGDKGGSVLLPLMVGFKMTTMLVMAMVAIALLILKAIFVGKLAFMLASIIGISKLLESHHKKSEMEPHIIAASYPVKMEMGGGLGGMSGMSGAMGAESALAAAYASPTYDAYSYGLTGHEAMSASELSPQYIAAAAAAAAKHGGSGNMIEVAAPNITQQTIEAAAAAIKRRDNRRKTYYNPKTSYILKKITKTVSN